MFGWKFLIRGVSVSLSRLQNARSINKLKYGLLEIIQPCFYHVVFFRFLGSEIQQF